LGFYAPFWEGELGPHLTQCRLGPGLYLCTYGIFIHPAVWPQQTWAENWVGAVTLLREVGPSNTVRPGLRPTSVPSFILIHQQFGNNTPTSETDRQYRTDRTTVR